MQPVPRVMYSYDNTTTPVDAASNIGTSWVRGADLNQGFSMWDIQAVVATTAILSYVVSATSSGASPYATGALEGGTALTANVAYNWSILVKA